MVNNRFPIFGLILYCICLGSGCFFSHDRFLAKGKGQATIKSNYKKPDYIIFKNYVLFNTKDQNKIVSTNEYIWPTDVDSLIKVFGNSLAKLDVKVKDSSLTGQNFIDENYVSKHIIRLKRVDEDWIKSVAYTDNEKDAIIILPFIYLYNVINFTGFIGSSGVASNNGFFISTSFDLLVYIIEHNKIIYSKHVRYVSAKSEYVESLFEARVLVEKLPTIRQEHWDELVRLALQDYIKRMR